MKKRAVCRYLAILLCMMLAMQSLLGCSATLRGDDDTMQESPDETGTKKKEKGNRADLLLGNSKDKKEDAFPEFLKIECVNSKMNMQDGDWVSAEGTCYSFSLDESQREAYSGFADLLDTINEETYASFCVNLQKDSDAAVQRHMDGWDFPYSEENRADVTRADRQAFSYSVSYYSYLGGAHGYGYYGGFNYDPVSSEKIPFDEVVTDPSSFPQIVYDELILQDLEMEEYFDTCVTDKENLLTNIRESVTAEDTEPVWTLTYDGIKVYFGDYSMGSYAAGSQIVDVPFASHPEIFNEKYFTYENGTPDVADQVVQKEVEDPVLVERDERFLDVGCNYEGWIHFHDEYIRLQGRMDDIGEQQFIVRADKDVYASVVSYRLTESDRTLVGINIEPDTGKDIPLDAIVSDLPAFEDALFEILAKEHYNEEIEEEIRSELHYRLNKRELVSSQDLSWTAGYEGITFYCNTTVNFSLPDMNNDAFTLFVPYSAYEDLFVEKYRNVPDAFAYQIPFTSVFSGAAYMDLNYDGNFKELRIYPATNEDRPVERVTFSVEGSLNTVDGFDATELSAVVVKSPLNDYFVYVQSKAWESDPVLRVFSFMFGDCQESEEDTVKNYEIDYPGGRLLIDPLHFSMKDGNRTLTDCCINSEGVPVSRSFRRQY